MGEYVIVHHWLRGGWTPLSVISNFKRTLAYHIHGREALIVRDVQYVNRGSKKL